MLQQKIIEKINDIFGNVDVYFDVEDITSTDKLAILVSGFEVFPLTNRENIESYVITSKFTFSIVEDNGWDIDMILNQITEYNQKNKDKVNIIYPYNVSDNMEVSLEFIVDINVDDNSTKYPIKDTEINIII